MMKVKTIAVPEVSDVDIAFGTVAGLPKMQDIPTEFKSGTTMWNKLFSAWFFGGFSSLKFEPREGVDDMAAKRHILALMASFEPKHEHKEAGVAYLMSRYFTDAKWERKQ